MVKFDNLLSFDQTLRNLHEDRNWYENLPIYIDFLLNIEQNINNIVRDHYISDNVIIESCTTIIPPVIILDNSRILSGVYIEGPSIIGTNCRVGPNCHIRKNNIILNNSIIGQGAEIKESIILDNCTISHFSYIGNSLIGKNVNIAAGVITAVRRFDNKDIQIKLGNNYNTKQKKFGAIIGDNVQLGIGVLIYPGRIIKPDSKVDPGTKIIKNII